MTDQRLAGKVALITGSDSGIGQATAIEFANEGADVVINYLHDADGRGPDPRSSGRRRSPRSRRTGRRQRRRPGRGDVRPGGASLGSVDILMNNAGIDASGTPVAELSTQVWDRAIRTNVYGPFFCCRRFAQLRIAAGGGGTIINVTSVHADNPNPGGSDYDCSKGAVRMLTRTLALELAEHGINVNSLAPGMVLTPFNQAAIDDPDLLDKQVQSIPMKRAAKPREIARLAVFLASSDAAYVTGASYVMDGGLMINLGQGA
jgi:glucose 1-dehydrogenase